MREATRRGHCAIGFILASGCTAAAVPAADVAADALADKPSELSVTVYRAPYRRSGSIELNDLGGFALVSEVRTVHLPAGTTRLRFEGVADGIEPASVIVTGLPDGVIEKNREGQLLSPAALAAAAVGKPLTVLRTDRKTGKLTRLAATIRSDAGGGVVLETSEGIEALRCSGLPETLSFTGAADLAATPTLSVRVRNSAAVTRMVTLSYLARDFDWAADYSATLSADGKTMDLGAWVTLANGNGVGFPAAHAQVVAGRLNRESGEVEPLDAGGPILARCWPRGSTSDLPEIIAFKRTRQLGVAADAMARTSISAAPAAGLQEVTLTAQRVEQEQLGDLKLYRVPERTDVAARQSKQVRLLDRRAIPVHVIYGTDLGAGDIGSARATMLLRTVNDAANHLGLPLPSGRVAVFETSGSAKILRQESGMRDLAVGEDMEISMGESSDVRIAAVQEKTSIDSAGTQLLPLAPGVSLRSVRLDDVERVEVTNARARAIQFELRLFLPEGASIVRADRPFGAKNGRPVFRLRVPANETVTLRYQTRHAIG